MELFHHDDLSILQLLEFFFLFQYIYLNILIQLFEDVFEHFYFENMFVNVDHKNYHMIFILQKKKKKRLFIRK
jgi:hypothetical protein